MKGKFYKHWDLKGLQRDQELWLESIICWDVLRVAVLMHVESLEQ